MRGIYGMSGFSSLFGASRGFSSMSSIYSNLSEYGSVKSGAYRKAVRAYYAKQSESDTTKKTDKHSKTRNSYQDELLSRINKSKNTEKSSVLSDIKTASSDLVSSAKKLTATGKDSLFSSDDKYDSDAAYKAVSSFVSDYNDTVEALKKTSNQSVSNSGNSMMRMTNVMKNSLSRVGITAGQDGKLSLDEDTFKNAKLSDVKAMFKGSGSFAGIVSSSASRITSQATSQMNYENNAVAYGRNGYYSNYISGSLYDGFF